MTRAITARGLSRTFDGPPTVQALRSASLDVEQGEKIAILGPSGAGKSTLLNLLGLLDEPTGGTFEIFGRETTAMSRRERDRIRRDSIGFVFQAYHVLGHRTVSENVLLKLTTARVPAASRARLVDDALGVVGLADLAGAVGRTLSGGEKQRLAIARAVVLRPRIMLADEPTGNLDAGNADAVLALLTDLAETGIAVVVITHDPRTAAWADRVVELDAGVLEGPDGLA